MYNTIPFQLLNSGSVVKCYTVLVFVQTHGIGNAGQNGIGLLMTGISLADINEN